MFSNDEQQATSPAAREILKICATGHYQSHSGGTVSIQREQAHSEASTRLYSPERLATLRSAAKSAARFSTAIEVVDATTQEAGHRFAQHDGVAVLNFASARHPGGGFLGGARAQEEELCRCSGLYRTLTTQPEYYIHNRAQKTLLYSDFLVYSPKVPFFRVASNEPFLETPFLTSVFTAAAPNAGAVALNEPESAPHLPSTLERRWANVLAVAEHNHERVLVLGAWGCGVFRNDPTMVATTAKSTLCSARFDGLFERIVFAIPNRGEQGRRNFHAFGKVFS